MMAMRATTAPVTVLGRESVGVKDEVIKAKDVAALGDLPLLRQTVWQVLRLIQLYKCAGDGTVQRQVS